MSDHLGNGNGNDPYFQPDGSEQQAQPQMPPYQAGYYGYPPQMTPPPHLAGGHHGYQMPPNPFEAQAGYQIPPHIWHQQQMWMHHQAYLQQQMMLSQGWPAQPQIDPQMPPQQTAQEIPDDAAQHQPSDVFFEQAQTMIDSAMGEEDASMFKEILGSLGMNDKEFWKGAMVGAAAALLLSNENVRSKLVGLVAGAGDMLKAGGSNAKDAATQTAQNVRDNVATSGEIFRDTYAAGKDGFQESVERHQHVKSQNNAFNDDVDPA